MSLSTKVEPTKVIVLYPKTKGFSYAVMESALELEEFAYYEFRKFDSQNILNKMREVIKVHSPATLVLENHNSKLCRKRGRSKQLLKSIQLWAIKNGMNIKYYSREQVRTVFEPWKAKTKFEIAEVLWRNIDKLKPYIFDKPQYPNDSPRISAVFSAVSLGVTHYFLTD